MVEPRDEAADSKTPGANAPLETGSGAGLDLGPAPGSIASREPVGSPEAVENIATGVRHVEQQGAVSAHELARYFGQKSWIIELPPRFFALTSRQTGIRPRKAVVSQGGWRTKLPSLLHGDRTVTELVPAADQVFSFDAIADLKDGVYMNFKSQVIFRVINPQKFIDELGLKANTPEKAAAVTIEFFKLIIGPEVERRLDALAKKVNREESDLLNAYPYVLEAFIKDENYKIDVALKELKKPADERAMPTIPSGFDQRWKTPFSRYGFEIIKYDLTSLNPEGRIARALEHAAAQKATAEARLEVAEIELQTAQLRAQTVAQETAGAIIRTSRQLKEEFDGDGSLETAIAAIERFAQATGMRSGHASFIVRGRGAGGGEGADDALSLIRQVASELRDLKASGASDAQEARNGSTLEKKD